MSNANLPDLDQLLKEAGDSNSKTNFEKIKELVKRSEEMRNAHEEHAKRTEEYFKTLKERLDESNNYLLKAKKDLENINCILQREKMTNINNMDYEEFLKKSDEEIQAEMDMVKSRLASLETRVKKMNKNSTGAEESLNKSIKTLQNISRGLRNDN